MNDEAMFETMVSAGRKRVFVDVKTNGFGTYVKIKEAGKNGGVVLIPTSSLGDLREALDEAAQALSDGGKKKKKQKTAQDAPAAAKAASGGGGKSLHVSNLAWTTTDQQVADHFAVCGDVTNALVTTTKNGRSQGWAIVQMARREDAAQAIEDLDGVELDGRALAVRYDNGKPLASEAKPAKEGSPKASRSNNNDNNNTSTKNVDADASQRQVEPNTIYVTNLSWETDWKALKAHCPDAVRADIIMRRDGKHSGNGTVEYANQDAADAAIDALNGTELDGREIRVRVAYKV